MYHALEAVFIGILVVTSLAIMWFAGYVVYKLFQGQR
jgi:hypothetical protein